MIKNFSDAEYTVELRKISEEVAANKMTSEDAKKKMLELRVKKAEEDKRIALEKSPIKKETTSNFEEVRKALVEKRAVTLNGTGAINQVKELVKELQKKTPLLGGVKYFYGQNASTNIPVFSPTIAAPVGYAEGASGILPETQAVLGYKVLSPRSFISLLKVSAEAIDLGSVNLEAELPAIFADAFAQGFHKAIATGAGTGNDFTGIFTVAAGGTPIVAAPGVKALRDLALQLQDYADHGVIIVNPSVYSLIMADATGGEVDLYKEELIRNKTIEGVSVLVTGVAPASIASGAIYAVGGRLENYGFAMASEIRIEPGTIVGDTNHYFTASVYANGNAIIDKEFIGIEAP
jgi:HK97 family phage major capsid protein